MDARSLQSGRDTQLERAVVELMKMIDRDMPDINAPAFPRPAETVD